jgi:outer membrane protein
MYSQPTIVLARAAMEAAAGAVRQAESGYFPTLSVAARHTKTGPSHGGAGASVGGQFTVGGYTTNFSASELIYDFGRTPATVGQARRNYDAAVQGYEQAREDLVLQVKQSYYALLQDQQLVGVQQQNLSDQQAHLAMAKARFDAGLAARADVASAEAAVAEAQLNLANAQNTEAAARVNLDVALDVDVRTPTQVEETEESAPAAFEPAALVEGAFARRAAVQQARASVEAAADALRQARASNRPSLSLNGSYGLTGTTFPPDTGSWAYGVSLAWPLFDVGLTRGRVAAAEANLLSARASLRTIEQGVAAQVVQAYLNVQAARQAVSAAQSEVASAEESLRLANGRYEAGLATYVEVLDAEAAALTARTNLVNARYGLSSSLASLEHAMGAVSTMGEGGPQ